MRRPTVATNERSWAIDLIGHLKQISRAQNQPVQDAGGEHSMRDDGGALFPDVLLFGDRTSARIMQGWELKMPDTGIDDLDFRENAERKARALGLESFVLWNVSRARLYVRRAETDTYVVAHAWDDLANVTSRGQVGAARRRWEAMAEDILAYVNAMFADGRLEGRQFIEAYRTGGITDLIMANGPAMARALATASRRNAQFRAEMTVWWDTYQAEYAGDDMETVLAQAVISNWIGKFLFAQILRERDQRAAIVAEIGEDTTPDEALEIFRRISEQCNFWTIFSDSLGLRFVPERVWRQLKSLNDLLGDLRVGSIDQAQLSEILETTVAVATRKLRGQYPTPIQLARILTQLCIDDIENDRVIDPCCGSGTIARAVVEQKVAAEVDPATISETVYAGDQDPQAVQIATFALARSDQMNRVLRIYQGDAFALEPDGNFPFRDPETGQPFAEEIGQFDVIVSNLPFIAQSGRGPYAPAIRQVRAALGPAARVLPGRADVAAYLPFSLHPLLVPGGRLGIIITNAWLGTDWGDAFYQLLGRYYDLKVVMTSGAGRWFRNSKVVTNILVLEKKADPEAERADMMFVTLKTPLQEFGTPEAAQLVAAQVRVGRNHDDSLDVRTVTAERMTRFRTLGLGGNAQFVDCDWVLDLPLLPLRAIVAIRRGERRGMNKMFYPAPGHGIEPDYIQPLLKSPTEFRNLRTAAVREAFSCNRSIEELTALGHDGALNWIEQFDSAENQEKLARPGQHWYEMDASALADLVLFINFGNRLFVGRADPPAFVDQRMVPLRALDGVDVDIDLCHALLNSAISLFMLEGIGFGRGLGALDLNKDRLERFLHILDPSELDDDEADAVKEAFAPLLERRIGDVADELEMADRMAFDDAVIEAFGLDVDRQEIYDSLLAIISIRQSARLPGDVELEEGTA